MSANPEPVGWRASLLILAETRSADQLATAVGLPPDDAWNVGDVRPSTRGLLHYESSGIKYRSLLPDAADVHDHLASLIDRLEPYGERIAALATELGAEPGACSSLRVWLVFWAGAEAQGLDFPPDQLRFIADIGAFLGISVECWDDEEEASSPPAPPTRSTG